MVEFEEAWAKIQEVVNKFGHNAPHHTISDVDFIPYEGDRSIEAHTRYWTDRKLIPREKNTPFSRDVDAFGVLQSIQPDVFIHGPDNIVEYCKVEVVEEIPAAR
jgi:hypothetical protein